MYNNFTVHLKYSSIFTAGIHVAAMTYTMGRNHLAVLLPALCFDFAVKKFSFLHSV